MVKHETIPDLVDQIYETIVDPSACVSMLQSLSDTFGGVSAGIAMAVNDGFAINANYNFSDETVHAYATEFFREDPWSPLGLMPAGKVMTGQEIILSKELEKSDYYHAVLKPSNQYDLIGASVKPYSSAIAGVLVHRSKKQSLFSKTDKHFFQLLAPHLQNLAAISNSFGNRGLIQSLNSEVLSKLKIGVMTVDQRHHIYYLNSVAEALVNQTRSLHLVKQRLFSSKPSVAVKLKRALALATKPKNATSTDVILPCGMNTQPLVLRFIPLRELVSMSRSDVVPPGQSALIFFWQQQWDRSRLQQTLLMLGLTVAEVRFAQMFVQRPNLEECCDQLTLNLSYGRWLLKQVMWKLECRSQAQVVLHLSQLDFKS